MTETTTLNIRNLDADAARQIKLAAASRDMTLPEFIARLVAVHDMVRARADAGDDALQAELVSIGMQTVSR